MGASVGAIVGLVAITPSAGWVTTGQSLYIGCMTSILCNIAVHWKDQSSIDDALDVFPTHGIGGVIGTIFTGVFVEGLLVGNVDVFVKHVLTVAGVCLFSLIGSWILYYLTNKIIPLRVSSQSEDIGLDESQHSEHYMIPIEDEPTDLRSMIK